MDYKQVFDFWFSELTPAQHFAKDLKLDQLIKNRFFKIHQAVSQGECAHWRESSLGSLSEIIVLDQFSRNIFRDQALSFAFDGQALVLAQEAIRKKFHLELNPQQKSFLYLPFMHSESRLIHEKAVELFSEEGLSNNLSFEIKHKNIIDRFGRYPHRNKILGRESTPEEIEFLQSPGSSF